MKTQTQAVLAVLLGGILIGMYISILPGCTSKSTVKVGRDSTLTSVLYVINWNQNDYRTSSAVRITYDTVMEIRDSTSGGEIKITKRKVRDTSYRVPIFVKTPDSVLNKVTGKKELVFDSVGQPKTTTTVAWPILPKKLLIVDYQKQW